MSEKKQCSAKVFDGDSYFYHSHLCSKPAVVEREGKWYCKIHDPEYIKAKRAKATAKWEAKMTAWQQKWAREEALNKATEGLTTEELLMVTPDMIRRALAELPRPKRKQVFHDASEVTGIMPESAGG